MNNDAAGRKSTAEDYQERLNRVLLHIQEHLDEPLGLEAVARVACLSPFHFHRIFSAFVGETLGEHVRRLRLEWAAHHLAHTRRSVTDIALAAGYEAPAAFDKAFRRHFHTTPTDFRGLRAAAPVPRAARVAARPVPMEAAMLKPEIRTRDEVKCVFVRRTGSYEDSARQAWEAVCRFAFPRGLVGPGSQMIGVSRDDPQVTAPDQLRYDACITVGRDVAPEGEVGVTTIAGGKYAVFVHQGPYEEFTRTYQEIYGGWLPASGMRLRDVPGLEIYLNSPGQVKPEELRTEICVPVE
jgi:AraC family transcriptional regulator